MPQTIPTTVLYFLFGVPSVILIWMLTLFYFRHRFRKHPKWHRERETFFCHVVVCIAIPVAFYYIYWRTGTINWLGWWSGVPLFLAEFYGVVVTSIHFFTVWRPTEHKPLPPLVGRGIDVFITTYNEPLAVIRKTARACVALNLPHTTYILDDGNRPEIAELAKILGCSYIARKDNKNAKAGNINNALKQTKGEFVAIFDADHVPQHHFLETLTGYFIDEKLAFVQTPQDFYNIDSYQHRFDGKTKNIWEEQSLFFSVIQPGKDYWNAAFWCGSCAILRRSALESIGGIATDSVTEDLHTSIRLHAKGYRSLYHNESLAYGLAPETFIPFHVQRLRWGTGSMQLLLHRDNPYWIKGLNWKQRLAYSASMTTYFDGFQKLVYYTIPMLYFLTGVLPIISINLIFFAHFLPYFGFFLLGHFLMDRGKNSLLVDEQYTVAKMFIYIRATTALLKRKKLRFNVTPKSSGENDALYVLLPQLIIFLMNAGGASVGIYRYIFVGDLDPAPFFVTLFWALCIAGYAFRMLRFSQKKVQRRRTFRFWYFVPCRLSSATLDTKATALEQPKPSRVGLVRDCHEYGASLLSPVAIEKGTALEVVMFLEKEPIKVKARVIGPEQLEKTSSGFFCLNTKFIDLERKNRHAILKYSFDFYVPNFMAQLDRGSTVFDHSENYFFADKRQKKRWSIHMPISYRYATPNGPCEILGVSQDISESGQSAVLCTDSLPLGEPLEFTIDLADQRIEGLAVALREKNVRFGGIEQWHYALKIDKVYTGDLSVLQALSRTDHLLRV